MRGDIKKGSQTEQAPLLMDEPSTLVDEWLQEALAPLEGKQQTNATDAGPAPLNVMEDGIYYDVPSMSSDTVYRMKFSGGTYSCNCPSWRNQKGPTSLRGCKHLLAHLGAEFEEARLGGAKPLRGPGKKALAKRKKKTEAQSRPTKKKKVEEDEAKTKKESESKETAPSWRSNEALIFEPATISTATTPEHAASKKAKKSNNMATKDDDEEEEEEPKKTKNPKKRTDKKGDDEDKKVKTPKKRTNIKEEADGEDEEGEVESKSQPKKVKKPKKQTDSKKTKKQTDSEDGGKEADGDDEPKKRKKEGSNEKEGDGDEDEDEPKKTKPALLLAQRWEGSDIQGWWMSEKLDGLRALWTGTEFISRLGNKFHAPPWFVEKFPKDIPLDGELWAGRGKFQLATSIVRSHDQSDRWKQLTFRVFDLPSVAKPFEERMTLLEELAESATGSYFRMVEQTKCENGSALTAFTDKIIADGGEGVMLREPNSFYVGSRSKTLLKVKRFQDAEAHVIEYQKGKGKHKGRMGALICKFVDAKEEDPTFKIGTGFTDDQRDSPPSIGSIITFKFQEKTKDGLPRFPVFVGEPIDR